MKFFTKLNFKFVFSIHIVSLNLLNLNLLMSIFNNTQIAFADKTDAQLRKAYWMFKAIEQPVVTKVGISALNFTVEKNFPFVTDIVKKTLFEQFCGGETREESMQVVKQMFKRHVGSIFDYAIEGKDVKHGPSLTLICFPVH